MRLRLPGKTHLILLVSILHKFQKSVKSGWRPAVCISSGWTCLYFGNTNTFGKRFGWSSKSHRRMNSKAGAGPQEPVGDLSPPQGPWMVVGTPCHRGPHGPQAQHRLMDQGLLPLRDSLSSDSESSYHSQSSPRMETGSRARGLRPRWWLPALSRSVPRGQLRRCHSGVGGVVRPEHRRPPRHPLHPPRSSHWARTGCSQSWRCQTARARAPRPQGGV